MNKKAIILVLCTVALIAFTVVRARKIIYPTVAGTPTAAKPTPTPKPKTPFLAEQSNIRKLLGPAAKKKVRCAYRRGEPLVDVIGRLNEQAGVSIQLADPSHKAKGQMTLDMQLATALANVCMKEQLTMEKTSKGDVQLVPKK